MSLETNLRVVRPGPELYVHVRKAIVEGPDLSSDILERACGRLRHQHRLAAVVVRGQTPTLFVATREPIPELELKQPQWVLRVADGGDDTVRLSLTDAQGPVLIPRLIERSLLATLAAKRTHWTLDSPRLWYEPTAFLTDRGIGAFRRFAITGVFVPDVGVCVAIDVGHAFLTEHSLEYFFGTTLSSSEANQRSARFAALTGRREGHKGTLVYDSGRGYQKCYFEKNPGTTCGTTGRIRVNNETFNSLADYYRRVSPQFGDLDDAAAVLVSFPGIDRPQWVAASRLRARVMTDSLPRSLASADKIAPLGRRRLLQEFWDKLEPRPLDHVAPGFLPGFWSPPPSRVHRFGLPELIFGSRDSTRRSGTLNGSDVRKHFSSRDRVLDAAGCYHVPPTIPRKLYFVYPQSAGDVAPRALAADAVSLAQRLTGTQFVSELIAYTRVADGIERLRRTGPSGAALFVLNSEPASYFEVQFQLQAWRIKRVTTATLLNQHSTLAVAQQGADPHGRRRWEQFVRLTTLDLLQHLDVIPWRISDLGEYDAQLAIDVGHDRRHLALSLLISRGEHRSPSFRLITDVQVKPDPKHETINARVLEDHAFQLFDRVFTGRFDALQSLLVLRDGRAYEAEVEALVAASERLKRAGYLAEDARIDLMELQKSSLSYIRLWEKGPTGFQNPEEGTAVVLSSDSVLLSSTGRTTLRQGTSAPLVLTRVDRKANPIRAAAAVFAAAQLNWSSPRVAQKLPLTLKRTDEELKTRAAQEIRRMW